MEIREITVQAVPELSRMYAGTFQSPPWNEQWTENTAGERLRQMVRAEGFYGIEAYRDEILCGAILGCMEPFFTA